ncbi:hypothetical protein QCA50_012380 [Cerrena zonata]|uniref:Uncharacterized protein n=1 Tax=Cerrena zonata TaxID=2478898 RepID=A0AAW0FTR5_9APHY
MYQISGGHAGALDAIAGLIMHVSKSRENQNPPILPLSLAQFYNYFAAPSDILKLLLNSGFRRSLPLDNVLRRLEPRVVNFFRDLLKANKIIVEVEDAIYTVAMEVRMRGWAAVEVLDGHLVAQFASPLHRAWMSLYLDPQPLHPKFAAMSLLDFVQLVICHFSSPILANPERHSTSSQPVSVPEGQWQNEFYRAAYALTDGCGIWLSPEFGTDPRPGQPGRIDFYISDKKWGIEILRDGDRVTEHLERFQNPRAYHQWIVNGLIEHYIVLDFRVKRVQKKYPGATNLYRIIFDGGYTSFEMLDCNSTVVHTGALLAGT